MEVLIEELSSELRVERTAIGYEGASLSYISNKTQLKRLELISIVDPTLFVVLKRVNKSVGLVHLLSGLSSSLLQSSLL